MDWGSLLSVLVGGVIAAGASLFVLGRQVNADRQTRLQERLIDLIADLIVAADDEWLESHALAQVRRTEEEHARETGGLPGYGPAWDQAVANAVSASRNSQRQLAKVRILAPDLYRPAIRFIGASGPYPPEDGLEAESKRDERMWAFEDAARKVLGIKHSEDAWVGPTGEGGK